MMKNLITLLWLSVTVIVANPIIANGISKRDAGLFERETDAYCGLLWGIENFAKSEFVLLLTIPSDPCAQKPVDTCCPDYRCTKYSCHIFATCLHCEFFGKKDSVSHSRIKSSSHNSLSNRTRYPMAPNSHFR